MAEQDAQGLVIVGSDGTEHEFPAGMDPQKAAAVVREQEATAKSGPLVRSRTGQMYRHPTEPISKDVVDGALSAVNPMSYVDMAKTALTQNPARTAMDAAEGLIKMPFRIAGGLVTEPAKTLGALTAGTVAGEAIPIAPRPIARGLGKALEAAGTKAEWPMQVAASHQILSGNPGGLAVMAIPPVLRKVGRGLKSLGTSAEQLKSEADILLQRGAPAPTPSIRVTPPASDFYKVAQENAAEAAAAKGGAVAGGPPVGWPANVPYKPEMLGPIQPLRNGPKVTTLGGGPAPAGIRVMGKAATDLAEGKVPVASKAPMPSDVRMDELAGKLGGQPAVDAPKPTRIPTQEAIPASKSKGPMSATPGLTKSDLEAVGLNPTLNYKDLTPDLIAKIKSMRSSRHGTHYANAATDKGLRSILEDSLLMRNMERLR